MPKLRVRPLLIALGLILTACGREKPNLKQSADGLPIRQQAAMILNYPHDDHTFGELPADLTPVPEASAQLERYADRVVGTIDTRITPGHVGKLLAVVINNPAACNVPTPATACGPHEEEFNQEADGGFYLGNGTVAGPDGRVGLNVTVQVGDATNVLCGGAANPDFDACANGFSLRDPHGAEVTLVVLDNGPAAEDSEALAQQLTAPSPCPSCPPFTAQVAIGFGQEAQGPPPG